jgi:O-antigen/teichoic acid export membrane protein
VVGWEAVGVVRADASSTRMQRNTAVLLFGQAGRLAIQGGYFVLVARELGSSDFGAAAALLALVALLLPFSGLGSPLLIIRNVAQERGEAALQWSNSVVLVVLSGTVLSGLLLLLSSWIAPDGVPARVVAAVAVADLVLGQLVDAARSVFHAKERMVPSAGFPVILQAGRLAAFVLLMVGPWSVTLTTWTMSYLLASLPVAGALAVATTCHVGWCRPQLREFGREWKTGMLFTVGMSTTTMYNDADKVLLAKLSTLEATGIYSAAYRIVDMSYVPVRALLGAALPAMWRAGMDGLLPLLDVVKARLLRPVTAYCLLGTAAMLVGADLMPLIFGASYQEAVPALRALSFLLILKGCHYVAADMLTCAGYQGVRTVVQICVAILNVALCLWLIPAHGWQGAVAASLASDGALALALIAILLIRLRSVQNQLPRARAD